MLRNAITAVGLVCLASAVTADPIHGTWKTQPGENGNFAHVAIADCNGSVCGTVQQAFNGAGARLDSDTVGKRMIWDMKPQGNGNYSGGKIWAPDKDKTYKSKMALSGDALKVSGCIGPICRGQTWTRIK